MNMLENHLYFWIGTNRCTLTFFQWNPVTNQVINQEDCSDWCVSSQIDSNIIVGKPAFTAFENYFTDQLFRMDENFEDMDRSIVGGDHRSDFEPDNVDLVCLLLCSLLERMKPLVKESCGVELHRSVTFHLLDFAGVFESNNLHFTSAVKHYTTIKAGYLSQDWLISALSRAVEQGNEIIYADESENLKLFDKSLVYITININEVFKNLVNTLQKSMKNYRQSLKAAVDLLDQVESIGDGNWCENQYLNPISENGMAIVDGSHLASLVNEAVNTIDRDLSNKNISVFGDYSKVIANSIESEKQIQIYDRLSTILFLAANINSKDSDFDFLKNLIIEIESDQIKDVKWTKSGDTVTFKHDYQLNLFGNSEAKLMVSICDKNGLFLSTEFSFSCVKPIDIGECQILIIASKGGDLQIEATPGDEMLITRSYKHAHRSTGKARPIKWVKSLVIF